MTVLICDEDLIRRLPLPLAQLYRRAHNAKTAHDCHQAAFYLWEAGLKLLGSVAIVEYAHQGAADPELAERLHNLARPALGHWWEFVRRLVPILADHELAAFSQVRELLLGRTREDLPRAAGLDAALRESLHDQSGPRATVRLTELFDRLVQYRGKKIGHGAAGLAPGDFYERMGRALLAGVAEIFGRLDVLAGGRLIYIAEVRQAAGNWLIQRYELVGESARRLEPLEVPRAQTSRLPEGERVYLDTPGRAPDGAASERAMPQGTLRSLHPLMVYDAEAGEMLFFNSRRGRQRTEYLCYTTGRNADRPDLGPEQRELLARILGMNVSEGQAAAWAEESRAEEPSSEEPAPPVQRTLGEFELLSELGRGGMAVVFRAWQPSLGRQVALKRLAKVGDPKADARFTREIHALGRVEHPHLIKVFTSASKEDQWFYAMELVEGATLADVCSKLTSRDTSVVELDLPTWQEAVSTVCKEAHDAEKSLSGDRPAVPQPLSPAVGPALSAEYRQPTPADRSYIHRMVELIRQVAEAAQALHEANVIHRDIKPGNIMVGTDGNQAVLMDLGLAQLLDESEGRLTRTRQFVGTLRYASPEQVLAVGRLSPRSDVYSLGVTLWELLTLRPLYGATEETGDAELMQRIQYQEPEPVRKYNPRVARDLQAVVMKCLEKDPNRRYASARELAQELRRFLEGRPVKARPIGLVRRGLRRLRRRPAVALGVVAALFVFLAATFALWYWDRHHRLKIDYFANIVKRWGVPEGIGRLSEEQARHRKVTHRIYRRGARVEKVETVNGRGHFTATDFLPLNGPLIGTPPGSAGTDAQFVSAPRECRYEYVRNEQGRLIEEIAYDRNGEVVWKLNYTTPAMAHYSDKRGFPRARTGSGAAYVGLVWTDEGFLKEVRYFDRNRRPRPNHDGSFGMVMELEERGLPVQVTSLDHAGKPVLHRDGYLKQTMAFDVAGNLIEVANRDTNGQLTFDKSGIAKAILTYDLYGNLIEAACHGLDGQLTFCKDGFARVTLVHDEHGNIIEIASLDRAGQLTPHRQGFTKLSVRYDERGHPIEVVFLAGDGQPAVSRDGFAKARLAYDARGNLTEQTFFGLEGQATLHKDGYARATVKYDERGNPLEVACFAVDGRPTLNKAGNAKVLKTYDEDDNPIETAYFGVDGLPTLHKDGYAKVTAKYDERGNQLEEAYFSVEGRPAPHKDIYAKWTAKYNEHGKQIERAFFDVAGRPAPMKDGIAKHTARYDDRDNGVQMSYFGADDKPVLHKDGCAKWTAKHDERGNEVERTFFGLDDRAVLIKDGYAKLTIKYDERGNQVEQAFFDQEGNMVVNKEGHARITWAFDERGNATETAFFLPDGGAARHPDGYARWMAKFDDRGNRVEVAHLDGAGEPARHKDGYAKWTEKYDESGNPMEKAYFDGAGRPVLIKDGYAKQIMKYDSRGYEIAKTFFGVSGQPTLHRSGYAKVTKAYDNWGNRLQTRFFDLNGNPTVIHGGYAKFTEAFDAHGNRTEAAFFGVDDRPTLYQEGVARFTFAYDNRGNMIEQAYFGVDGEPVRHINGYLKSTYKYDAQGRRIEDSFLGYDNRDGFYQKTYRFDEHGNTIAIAFFDERGQPVRQKDGHHQWTAKYNARRQRIEESWTGLDGSQGFHQQTVKYDSFGNRVEEAYFDEAGKAVHHNDGYARLVAKYDRDRNKVDATYLNMHNQTVRVKPVVVEVVQDSQAAKLGLKQGDILLQYDGRDISNRWRFMADRSAERPADPPRELVVRRGDAVLRLQVRPGSLGVYLTDRAMPDERAAQEKK